MPEKRHFWLIILPLLTGALVRLPRLPDTLSADPTVTPLPTETFRITLAEMGYGEKSLVSPCSDTRYSFRLPLDRRAVAGSRFDLEYGYSYVSPDPADSSRTYFGDLQVYLDEQLLLSHPLEKATLTGASLRIPLPPEILNAGPGARHDLTLSLDAAFLCNVPHNGTLVIHPTSALELHYRPVPLDLDLADYPKPFYQRSFRPDVIHFVLPERPSEEEVEAAAALAARLGRLTSGLVVSVTTDGAVLAEIRVGHPISDHLFVIGRPTTNRLTRWLEEHIPLPITIHHRTGGLRLIGPGHLAPGETGRYTATLTNPTAAPLTDLLLTIETPGHVRPAECWPDCAAAADSVAWQIPSLPPGAEVGFHLTVVIPPDLPPTGTQSLDAVAVLRGKEGEPLNIASSAGPAGADTFLVWEDRPIPTGDGVLRELISPWDPGRAILLVTGGSDDAVRKAGQALGMETPLSPLSGPVAQIRDVLPPVTAAPRPQTTFTFADLGYGDRTVYGAYSQDLSYRFFLPLDWEPTEEAVLHLLFGHAAVLDRQASTLSILINGTPLGGILLDDSNAVDGTVDLPLPPEHLKRGANNELTLRVWMLGDKKACERMDRRQLWLTVSKNSAVLLPHRKREIGRLDLRFFPYPFAEQSGQEEALLFVLPSTPDRADVGTLLRLAALLGGSPGENGGPPRVSLGGDLEPATLSRYHIIAVGRPSLNPLVQRINSSLPQPFLPDSDLIGQWLGGVLLRLPPDVRLGYLQETVSPWNRERALLVVAGTADEGLAWAVEALRKPWKLRGNLALIRAPDEIQSVDTRGLTESGLASAVATALPKMTPAATPAVTPTMETVIPTPTAPPSAAGGTSARRLPLWVKAVVGLTALVVSATLGGVLFKTWRHR